MCSSLSAFWRARLLFLPYILIPVLLFITSDYNVFSALSSVSLTTPSPGKSNKLENIRNWTISTYKCSRQSLYEKLGKTNRTVDSELEGQIETLRDTQRKYGNILRLARTLTSHFYNVVQTQVPNTTKL